MHKPTLEEGRNAFDAGNCERALEVFKLLAEQGNVEAYSELAEIYFLEENLIEDEEEIILYRKLANAGDAFGQFMLGLMYDTGQGVAQNNGEAVKWYRRSAKQGVVQAQFSLAKKMYLKETSFGLGDDVQVYKWALHASSNGHKGAKQLLKKLMEDKNRKIKFDFNNREHCGFFLQLQAMQHKKDIEDYADGAIERLRKNCEERMESFEAEQGKIEENEIENPKDETRNGLVTEYYEDGQKKLEKHYKEEIENGRWTEWYPNGKKKLEKHFKDGKEEGVWTEWSEDGKKTYEGHFKDGNEE